MSSPAQPSPTEFIPTQRCFMLSNDQWATVMYEIRGEQLWFSEEDRKEQTYEERECNIDSVIQYCKTKTEEPYPILLQNLLALKQYQQEQKQESKQE